MFFCVFPATFFGFDHKTISKQKKEKEEEEEEEEGGGGGGEGEEEEGRGTRIQSLDDDLDLYTEYLTHAI